MLYVLSERGWPVLAFRPPTERRFTVLAVFRDEDREAAMRLLDELARRAARDAKDSAYAIPARSPLA